LRGFLQAGLISLFVLTAGTISGYAQIDPFNRDAARREEEAKIVKDMLSKQQSERDKKEHEALLRRAENALEISDELEKALEETQRLTPAEEKKLVELEKVVKKIRDDLGGDDDEEADKEEAAGPKDVKDLFVALRKSTLRMVEEVNKTTRFSISAAAIQSSNTVLRLVRMLRFSN
jgi:hypothetical protein